MVAREDKLVLGSAAQGYEIAAPRAGAMIEAFRGFGYTPQTAIADLIDNSITAGAKNVWLHMFWSGAASYLTIRDDGKGMSEPKLSEAMRPGSKNPLQDRPARDLGRFGLGLKTASFSQCRRLTVRSRERGAPTATRRWDLDYVASVDEWRLLTDATGESEPRLTALDAQAAGTVVLWENMDRIVGAESPADEKAQSRFNQLIEDIETHLAMVFHRYLERRPTPLTLWINGRRIAPWDPFLRDSPATQVLGEDTIIFKGQQIVVQPYVLPHHSKIHREVHMRGAGPAGWNAQQGFYVYRNQRLLVAGDWLGLPFSKEEHYKLARIQLDIPNSMDQDWQIDVRKSRAWPPAPLREDFRRIAAVTRERAVAVYRLRGKALARSTSADYVYLWERRVQHGKLHYHVNRDHPLVRAILDGVGERRSELNALLRLIEETVPVPLIAIDHAEKPDEQAAPFEGTRTQEVAIVLQEVYRALQRNGLSASAAHTRLLTMEPFHHFPELIAALDERESLETRA